MQRRRRSSASRHVDKMVFYLTSMTESVATRTTHFSCPVPSRLRNGSALIRNTWHTTKTTDNTAMKPPPSPFSGSFLRFALVFDRQNSTWNQKRSKLTETNRGGKLMGKKQTRQKKKNSNDQSSRFLPRGIPILVQSFLPVLLKRTRDINGH